MFKYSIKHGRKGERKRKAVYEEVKDKDGNIEPKTPPILILNPPQKLEWKLSPKLIREIERSYQTFKRQILSNETATLNFEEFGGSFIKVRKRRILSLAGSWCQS